MPPSTKDKWYTRDERHALAETLRHAGPDAPTLCDSWHTRELAAHLVLRERTLVEPAGRLPIAALQRRAEQAVQDAAAARPYDDVVSEFDAGVSWRDFRGTNPTVCVWGIPAVSEQANLLEYLVHHEDVLRGGPTWTPRELPAGMQRQVFRRLGLITRVTLRKVPVGLTLAAPGIGEHRTRRARRGEPGVRVTGDPVELALVAFGRIPQAEVEWSGDPADIRAVRGADISL